MATSYAPERGDIVWLYFSPQSGHEQGGRRPALVLSPRAYNRKVGLALCCPITSKIKEYPFEVRLPDGIKTSGAVLSDQIKCLDWRTRKAKRICAAPREVIEEVTAKLLLLVNPV